MPTLVDLADAATLAQAPSFISPIKARVGGVDPLGLRQINLDLMDQVLPGLNNVARHIRPFVVVTWAWRRATQCAQALGKATIRQDDLQDFVDRIEVLYAISQFLRDDRTDLPGSRYLMAWLGDAQLEFGGEKWQRRRGKRRYSTALPAPINYGPGLRRLGWVTRNSEFPGVMNPNPAVAPALDAFERQIASALDHESFNVFGSVTVSSDDVRQWGDLCVLDEVSEVESKVMKNLLIGSAAPVSRRLSVKLMLAAADYLDTTNVNRLRAAMTGLPSESEPPNELLGVRDKWRFLQMRQLFRLSLEALFFWTIRKLDGSKRSIEWLVDEFLLGVPHSVGAVSAHAWIQSLISTLDGPIELMNAIEQALNNPRVYDLPTSIARGLAFSLTEETPKLQHQSERLPLVRAQEETRARFTDSVSDLARHILESWVLAQHTYWSVGRGLADARAHGRMLLRLRTFLDEGGWTLTPGSRVGEAPRPTADRLYTAISLARECGLLAG